jgi:hypothetical protein
MGLPETIINFCLLNYLIPAFVCAQDSQKICKKGRWCKLKELVQMGAKRITVVHRVFLLTFRNLFKDYFSSVIS